MVCQAAERCVTTDQAPLDWTGPNLLVHLCCSPKLAPAAWFRLWIPTSSKQPVHWPVQVSKIGQASTGQLYWFPLPAGGRPLTQVARTGWFTPCTTRPLLVPPSSCWALGACVVQMKQVHKTTTGQSARSRPNLTQSNQPLSVIKSVQKCIFGQRHH